MHDIGSTYPESEYEYEADYEDDFEDEGEFGYELEGDFEGEFEEESDFDLEGEFEDYFEAEDFSPGRPFSEQEESELASDLLSVSSDQEMDYFFGKLLKTAARTAKKILKSKTARSLLKSVIKRVAQKALPIAGTAAGTFFGGPVGAKLGGMAGNIAGKLVQKWEMEGLSLEDQEFEAAKQVVRLTGLAAQRAAKLEGLVPHPSVLVAKAVRGAARSLFRPIPRPRRLYRRRRYPSGAFPRTRNRGYWQRSGGNIVLRQVW